MFWIRFTHMTHLILPWPNGFLHWGWPVFRILVGSWSNILPRCGSGSGSREQNQCGSDPDPGQFLPAQKVGFWHEKYLLYLLILVNFLAHGSRSESAFPIRIRIQKIQIHADADPKHWRLQWVSLQILCFVRSMENDDTFGIRNTVVPVLF